MVAEAQTKGNFEVLDLGSFKLHVYNTNDAPVSYTHLWTLHSYTQHKTVQGWSSMILSVWLVGGVILVSLGIVGEYIGKIYIEVKDRPRYNCLLYTSPEHTY